MTCKTTRVTIENDVNGRLLKTMQRAASKQGVINRAMETILAGYLNNNPEFTQFVRDSGRVNKDFNSFDELNQNVLYSLLKEFFNKKHLEVTNSSALRHSEALYGFTSSSAKRDAILHTADRIIALYYQEFAKPKSERLSYKAILNKVRQDINRRAKEEIIDPLIARLESNDFKDKPGVKEAVETYKKIQKEFENAKAEFIKNRTVENSRALDAAADNYIAAGTNIVNNYEKLTGQKNGAEINYINLRNAIRGNNNWFKLVFGSHKMTNIVRDFENTLNEESHLISDYNDISDFENTNSDRSVDESAKSWEDSLHRAFDKLVSPDLKLYLGSLFNCKSPEYSWDAENGRWVYQYDDNSELGVPMTMSPNFIISQICNGFVSFNSVDDFINDVERLARVSPNLYGLVKFANDMRMDRVFANKAFTQLHNPRISKFMVVLTQNGIDFIESNKNSTGRASMIYRMLNSIKSTANTAYDQNDEITAERLINEIESEGLNATPTENATYESIAFDFIVDTIKKYFPDVEKSAIRNYLYSSASNKQELFLQLLNDISDLIGTVGKFKDDYNQKYNEFINGKVVNGKRVGGYKSWAMAKNTDPMFDQPAPIFDYSKLDYDKFTKHVITLVNKLNNFSVAKIELNSTNAEGNMQSDLINNSFITNLLQQIAFGTEEESNLGLRKLADFIGQGEQYIHNPLFFGVRDSKNRIIQEGLFTRHANGKIDINKNAKDLITIGLFNGAKDNVGYNAALYTGMSKNDYFLSSIIAFHNFVNTTDDSSLDNSTHGGFFLRTPSDAPKNFIVQTKKYNTKDLWRDAEAGKVNVNNIAFRALHSHLIGEINNFIEQLNNVLDRTTWTSRTNLDGLFDKAHYDKELITDGRFSGNFFKFLKLFNTDSYNAGEEIIKALSLYGGDNALLIYDKSTNTISLNTARTDIISIIGDRVKLNTSNIQDSLNNIISNWLNAFRLEIIERTKQYEDILTDRYTNEEVIDCMINNAIMEMSFDDIFEGGSEFYKDAQEFLKRAKEVQAGGKSYAGFDLKDDIGGPIKNTVDNVGKELVVTVNGRPLQIARRGNNQPTTLPVRNGFKGVTIYNTIKPSENAGRIKQELIEINKDKLGIEQATAIATEIAAGYFANTKVNDAQSYITFEEWIRRKYLDGTINDYASIIEDIYAVRRGEKSIKDIDLKGISARVQVQKNFYFDKQYDVETRSFYPRQIKNAEFVIIPELVKGTDLEKLYDIMIENGIDQVNTVETDKAAKRTILTFWDNKGVANPKLFTEQLKAPKTHETYYYRYLYKQQDIQQHLVDEKNKAGIQIMKKILDNASPEVKDDVDNLMKNFTANIKDDFNRLIHRMGWVIKEDGSLANPDGSTDLKFDEFYRMARIEAQRLDMNANFIDYLTPNELGNPIMPNYMSIVSTKLESIAQSIFNNAITRQTLPGWHGAQVTSVGHGVKVLDSKGTFRTLKYHPEVKDKDGNIITEAYAEIMIPRWSNLIPKDYDISKLEDEGLDIHIGYRI